MLENKVIRIKVEIEDLKEATKKVGWIRIKNPTGVQFRDAHQIYHTLNVRDVKALVKKKR